MKVMVKVSGFYGGTWFEEGKMPQEMPDGVAMQFLPPHGDQLALPAARRAAEKPAAPPADGKKAG